MSDPKPQISIIIPAFNRAKLLSETLDSVVVQTFTDWECIVVDDGSLDNTESMMKARTEIDHRFKYYKRPSHMPKGANACRNYGFEKSEGTYIQWFDSDDLMPTDKLEVQLKSIESVDAPFTYCNFSVFRNNVDAIIIERNNIVQGIDLLSDYVTGVVNVNTPCFFWRRTAVSNVHFDVTIQRAQELDFHFRVLSKLKKEGVFIDKNLALIRDHTDSITGKTKKGDRDKLISEVQVRKQIFEYMINHYPENIALKCFDFYLEALYQASKHIPIFTMRTYLNNLKKYAKGAPFTAWRRSVTALLIVHRLTGRNLRLKNKFFSFPKKSVLAQNS